MGYVKVLIAEQWEMLYAPNEQVVLGDDEDPDELWGFTPRQAYCFWSSALLLHDMIGLGERDVWPQLLIAYGAKHPDYWEGVKSICIALADKATSGELNALQAETYQEALIIGIVCEWTDAMIKDEEPPMIKNLLELPRDSVPLNGFIEAFQGKYDLEEILFMLYDNDSTDAMISVLGLLAADQPSDAF